jgi:hypothetical protein
VEQRVLYRDPALLTPLEGAVFLATMVVMLVRPIGSDDRNWLSISISLGAIAVLLWLWRRFFAPPVAVLDSRGITLPFREGGIFSKARQVLLPWANVAGASVCVVQGRSLKRVLRSVAIAVCDLELFLESLPEPRRAAARASAARFGGPARIPEAKGLSLAELVEVIESYTPANDPATISPTVASAALR